jgi:hypothetical protein
LRNKELRILQLEGQLPHSDRQCPIEPISPRQVSTDSKSKRLEELRRKMGKNEDILRNSVSGVGERPETKPNNSSQESKSNLHVMPREQRLPDSSQWPVMVAELEDRLKQSHQRQIIAEDRLKIVVQQNYHQEQQHGISQTAGERSIPNMVWPVKVAELEGELQEANENLKRAEETNVCLEEGLAASTLDGSVQKNKSEQTVGTTEHLKCVGSPDDNIHQDDESSRGDLERRLAHNSAFTTTRDLELEIYVLHYDWYATRFEETVSGLFDFLQLETRAEPEPFESSKVYQ